VISAATDFTMHMDGWGAGAWALIALGMVLFWGLVIFGVIWLVRTLGGDSSPRTLSATDVLERRLAEGDISLEEYVSAVTPSGASRGAEQS
jgi:putative membrane protein